MGAAHTSTRSTARSMTHSPSDLSAAPKAKCADGLLAARSNVLRRPKQYYVRHCKENPRKRRMLKVSRLADYGTVIMARMAREPERLMSAAIIAVETGLSLP